MHLSFIAPPRQARGVAQAANRRLLQGALLPREENTPRDPALHRIFQVKGIAQATNRRLLQAAIVLRDPWRKARPGVMRSIFQTPKLYERGHWQGRCSPLRTQNVKQRTRIRTAQMSHAILQTCRHCWAVHVKVKCLQACNHCWAGHAQVKLFQTVL